MRAHLVALALASCASPTRPVCPTPRPAPLARTVEPARLAALSIDTLDPLIDREAMLVAGFHTEREHLRIDTHFAVYDARLRELVDDAATSTADHRAELEQRANRYLAHGRWHPMLPGAKVETAPDGSERWQIPDAVLEVTSLPDGTLSFRSGTAQWHTANDLLPRFSCKATIHLDRLAFDPVTQVVYIEFAEQDEDGWNCVLMRQHAFQLPFGDRVAYPAKL